MTTKYWYSYTTLSIAQRTAQLLC